MKNKEIIFSEIIKSKKYSIIKKEVIIKIADEEFSKYKDNKSCIKAVKNKLHQIHESFLSSESNRKARQLLESKNYDAILNLHKSTQERLKFYPKFYKEIFKVTGIPNIVLDIACGYNPFSITYMNLSDNFKYYAYDINEESNDLLNEYFILNNYDGIAQTLDITQIIPEKECDIALILKFLPLIDQQPGKNQQEVLTKIRANYIVISFPTKTLTGRNVGMQSNYSIKFKNLIEKEFEILKEIIFENEIVFIIKRK